MPVLDISDHAFVPLRPAAVRASADGPCALGSWVPGLGLAPVADRGDEGLLWRAAALDPEGRRWRGTAEVWLEPWHDGTVVHVYVRLDPEPSEGVTLGGAIAGGPRQAHVVGGVDRWREALRDRWRATLLRWRRAVDDGRSPGTSVPE